MEYDPKEQKLKPKAIDKGTFGKIYIGEWLSCHTGEIEIKTAMNQKKNLKQVLKR